MKNALLAIGTSIITSGAPAFASNPDTAVHNDGHEITYTISSSETPKNSVDFLDSVKNSVNKQINLDSINEQLWLDWKDLESTIDSTIESLEYRIFVLRIKMGATGDTIILNDLAKFSKMVNDYKIYVDGQRRIDLSKISNASPAESYNDLVTGKIASLKDAMGWLGLISSSIDYRSMHPGR